MWVVKSPDACFGCLTSGDRETSCFRRPSTDCDSTSRNLDFVCHWLRSGTGPDRKPVVHARGAAHFCERVFKIRTREEFRFANNMRKRENDSDGHRLVSGVHALTATARPAISTSFVIGLGVELA